MNTKNETLHLIGVNKHIGGVELFIGTEDELHEIATAGGRNEIFEVAPEEKADPDSPWPEGAGWYYAFPNSDCVKVESHLEAIAAILQNDGHPLYFTVEQAKKIVENADAGQDTGLWHHNRSKVISAISRCLEERELVASEPDSKCFKDWNGKETAFCVGARVLVHEDDGTLWEAKLLGFTTDGSLHLESENDEGFESPSICEVIS
jgi:hypothetical protein